MFSNFEFFHHYLQASRLFTQKLNQQLSQINMYHAQWMILYYLHQFGQTTLVSISNYFEVEKPTITRTVNRLQELGMIEQIPGKDKRERRIQLTELGAQVYKDGQHIVKEFEQSVMKNIPEIDLERTLQIVQQLQKNLKGEMNINEE